MPLMSQSRSKPESGGHSHSQPESGCAPSSAVCMALCHGSRISGFFVAFGEASAWHARASRRRFRRKLLQAPEADRVIARSL
jgi:hypothetical protein